ncbi:MAG: hypothetical protein Kow0042_20010 [Calditrichia bacterium]
MKYTLLLLFLCILPAMSMAQNHLLISEVQVAPSAEEFIEIFNPNPFPLGLDSIYLSDYNTYYLVVNNTFTTNTTDFLVKFPSGTTIDSAGVIVIALDGGGFSANADFEILGTSPTTPDMEALYVPDGAGLANSSEMLIMFYWDGESNRIYDIDYLIWGSTVSNFVDKSGVAPYADDTPVGAQHPGDAPISGSSLVRISALEAGEQFLNGNGITGHNETSEPIDQNFTVVTTPTPGTTTLEIPTGDGTGRARVSPDSVEVNSLVDLEFTIVGTVPDTLTRLSLTTPNSWEWSTNDFVLQGNAFENATAQITDKTILIQNAQVTPQDSGKIEVNQLTTPSQPEQSIFEIQTAVAGGNLKAIDQSPVVTVWKPVTVVPIAQIQSDPNFLGQQVIIEGIVVLGAGITTTGWTDAYVQDTSKAGINIYRPGEVDTQLVRGYRVRINGTVDEFNGVTEIVDYTVVVLSRNNPLPDPVVLSTQAANNVDLEGTFVEVSGQVTDFAPDVGGGTNIRVDDGSGECLIRVWNTTGVNLSGVAPGQQLRVRGPLDIYQGATQLLLSYQEDFTILQTQPGDGSGTATVTPDSVEKGQSGVELDFTISGESPYIIESLSLSVPENWQWGGDYQLIGFTGSVVSVQNKQILISQASVSASDQNHIILRNLTAPNEDVISTFVVKTAVSGGMLTAIASSPRVVVGAGIASVPIADIQQNTAQYLGQEVTVLGVVVLGAGVTTTGWTSAYVQDNSGYGINIYQSGTVDTRLKRGNLVVITGEVDEFNGVTEIVNYTLEVLSENNKLPSPLILSTAEANDIQWEGTFIEVQGEITDLYSAGGGTNILLDDGSGETLLRIWDTAGLNLTDFAIGDTIVARGPMGIYQGAAQLLVAYQEDIFKPGAVIVSDGNGFATISPDTLAPQQGGISVTLTLWGTAEDTLRKVHILLPNTWGWSGQAESVSLAGSGLANAGKKVILEYGEYRLELTDCFLTVQDSGFVTISDLITPADSVYSYFWVKTAVAGGTPRFIAQSPRVRVGKRPFYLIRDIQINSFQFTDSVSIRGVVTVGAGVLRTDRTSAYMQDESGYGINLSRSGQPDTLHFQRGYLVRVTGLVSEYRQTTQLDPINVQVLEKGVELPSPVRLGTGEANQPRWDGTLVQVRGVVTEKYTTSTQAPYDYNIVMNDGTGEITLRVWGTTGINLDSIEVNDAIIATGVGSVFIDRDGNPIYQILPAYQDDLLLDPTYQPSLEGVSLDVPANPFVPDHGEKIRIRYNAGAVNNQITIRIFDLGGRLITTILDESARLIVNTVEWDGRNELLDYVPLGTYICHLEVIEPVSGKKRVKMAPIVVGTLLQK